MTQSKQYIHTGKLVPAHTMPYTIPAITTPNLSRWKSHTAISEWQIHTQEHSWNRTTTILRSFAGVSADSTVAAGTAARTHCLGCCCCCSCCYSFKCDLWPDTFHLNFYCRLPAPPLRHRRSRPTFLCRGKNHPRPSTPPPAVPTARDWEYNHAHRRRRVVRVDTSLPAIARTFTPCIQAISSRSGVFVVLNTATKSFFMNIKSSNHFCTHHLSVGFLVQLPTITCALSASCAARTRVLGLESTDHAGPHCTCALCVSAARQLTTAVPPSHIICAVRTTASSLRVDIRAD